LLLVLVVLAIAGTVLAASARRYGQLAVRAAAARRDLQLTWAGLSCQRSVLPMADRLIVDAQKPGQPPLLEAHYPIALGGILMHLIVGDEMAKANVNALGNGQTTQAGLVTVLQRLLSDDTKAIPVSLRPRVPAEETGSDTPTSAPANDYDSYDQVFAIAHPWLLTSSVDDEGSRIRRRLSCWGGVQVNLKRAEPAVLQEVLSDRLTGPQISSLVGTRASQPDFSVAQILEQLHLTPEKANDVAPMVTEASESFSLWVFPNEQRPSWVRLYIQRHKGEDVERWEFTW
jgi:hypothetical protein